MNQLKYYEYKLFVLIVQTLTIVLIGFAAIPVVLKLMLVFGYVMLFRQKRWHKHLLIMFVMVAMMHMASGGFDKIVGIIT